MKKCLNYIKLAAVAMTALPLFTGCGTGCTGIEYNVIEDCFGSWDARYTINVEGDQTGPTPAWFYIYSDKGTAFISIQGDGFSLSVKGIDYRGRIGDIHFSTATGRDTYISLSDERSSDFPAKVTGNLTRRVHTRCSPANFPDDIFSIHFLIECDVPVYGPDNEPLPGVTQHITVEVCDEKMIRRTGTCG